MGRNGIDAAVLGVADMNEDAHAPAKAAQDQGGSGHA
jgi:hypothetical protein